MFWLNRLKALFNFGQKQIFLRFSEIEDFLVKNSIDIKKITVKEDEFKQKLLAKARTLQLALAQLERANPNFDRAYSEKLFISGQALKENYCRAAKKIALDREFGVEDFLKQMQTLFKIYNLDPRKAEVLGTLYPKEMDFIRNTLIAFKKELDLFELFVRRELSKIKHYDELKQILNKAKALREEGEKRKNVLENLNSQLKFLEDKKVKLHSKLNEIDQAKKHEIKNLEEEARKIEEENKKLCEEIDAAFAETRKILKKFKYRLGESAEARIINEYLSSPSQALFIDPSLSILKILAKLKSTIDKGELPIPFEQKIALYTELDKLAPELLKSKQHEYLANQESLRELGAQKAQILTPLVFKEKALLKELDMLEREIVEVQQQCKVEERRYQKHKLAVEEMYTELKKMLAKIINKRIELIEE